MAEIHEFLMAFVITLFPSIFCDSKWVILHDNDISSKFDEITDKNMLCMEHDRDKHLCVGGMVRTAEIIAQHRHSKVNKVLYFNTGSTLMGSVWFITHKAKIATEFMNLVMPDVMGLGIKDLMAGTEHLEYYIHHVRSPVVSTNIEFPNNSKIQAKVRKSHILNVDDISVGVMGYVDRDWQNLVRQNSIVIQDEISSLVDESYNLVYKGASMLIVLGNSGYHIARKIAEEIDLINILISGGGNDNPLMYNGKSPMSYLETSKPYPLIITHPFNNPEVPLVRTIGHTKFMGCLNITVSDSLGVLLDSSQPIYLSNHIPKNKEAVNLLNRFAKDVVNMDKETVGETKVFMEGSEGGCERKECNLGNLVADACVEYVTNTIESKQWSYATIALIPAGTIEGGIDATDNDGKISLSAILDAIAVWNTLSVVTVSGEYLRDVLEHSASQLGYDTLPGGFLQVSGLRLQINSMRPIGSRLLAVRALCRDCPRPKYELIRLDTLYYVIVTKFLTEGVYGYYQFTDKCELKMDVNVTVETVIRSYLAKRDYVYPEIDGRISITSYINVVSDSTTSRRATRMWTVIIVLFLYNSYSFMNK